MVHNAREKYLWQILLSLSSHLQCSMAKQVNITLYLHVFTLYLHNKSYIYIYIVHPITLTEYMIIELNRFHDTNIVQSLTNLSFETLEHSNKVKHIKNIVGNT